MQAIAGRVGAVVAEVADLAEAVAGVDQVVDAAGLAAGVTDAASGLLFLPSGPVMLLGLAPGGAGSPGRSSWPSQQVWRVTEAVSLVVAVAGYGYCRADAERRRGQPLRATVLVASATRPSDGL